MNRNPVPGEGIIMATPTEPGPELNVETMPGCPTGPYATASGVASPLAPLALLRLFQLISPSLPTGGFAYSQGLEWAINAGWIKTAEALERWLTGLLGHAMTRTDIPLLARLYQTAAGDDINTFRLWADTTLALRETSELRMEEKNRGRALARILKQLEPNFFSGAIPADWFDAISGCHLAGVALASALWQIPLTAAASGYLWSWLENQVLAGVKIIPLGQSAGQQMLLRLSSRVPEAAASGLAVTDDGIGQSLFSFAIAGCRHETQHTRLFRS